MKSLRADSYGRDALLDLTEAHVDITGACTVEVQANHAQDTLWVNVNGICVLRICRIERLFVRRR